MLYYLLLFMRLWFIRVIMCHSHYNDTPRQAFIGFYLIKTFGERQRVVILFNTFCVSFNSWVFHSILCLCLIPLLLRVRLSVCYSNNYADLELNMFANMNEWSELNSMIFFAITLSIYIILYKQIFHIQGKMKFKTLLLVTEHAIYLIFPFKHTFCNAHPQKNSKMIIL